MKSQRSFQAAVFFTALLFGSCKKDQGDLGLLIQPEGDELYGEVVDTFSLITYTNREDSVRSDEFSNNMLGSYVDPVFGKTTMSFYTQIRLSANNPVFDVPNIVIDSVVLSLVYQSYYGELDPQNFKVHEVQEVMNIDTDYYSNQDLAYDPLNIIEPGYATKTPDLTNYFYHPFSGDSAKPQLRLRLENSLGQRFINESGTGNLADNTVFTSWFKGFYITVDNPSQSVNEGGILYLDAAHDDSRLTIYYRDTNLGDTLEFSFLINSNCARYTRMVHDYTSTLIEAQLNDSTLGQSSFFLQSGAGVYSTIKFPHLLDLVQDGPVIVNRAELVFPVEYYSLDPYTPALQVTVMGIDDNGDSYFIKDRLDSGVGDLVFGGYYDDVNKEYHFVITRHVNDLLRGVQPNNGLRISNMGTSVSAFRAVLNGQNTVNRVKPYLKLIYTKY